MRIGAAPLGCGRWSASAYLDQFGSRFGHFGG
jgi:hypothetical protein